MNDIRQHIKAKLNELPKKPGCYLMKNSEGTIIYVGKAKVLANRVKSYFVGSHDAKTTKLVSEIVDFEYIITSTETEAFVLEINLIKKHDPKYNIMLTDDKRYPYICITNERHPKIYYTRELGKKAKYFGPYPNAQAAKMVVEMLNKIYPLRKCRTIPKKECLYYHLNQCLAPCIKEVPKEKYQEITSKITSFLKGNIKDEIKEINLLMQQASENLEFEKAIEYRNILNDLKEIASHQKMELEMSDTDCFGYYADNGYISIQIFHIRGNKMVERSGFLLEEFGNIEESFLDFIRQFYLIQGNPIPKEILIPANDSILEMIENIDEALKNKISVPKIGKKKELVNLVIDNAKEKIDTLVLRAKREFERTGGAMEKLSELLGISVRTLEAFDNSNIQGASAVSAMVSYVDGKPNKKGYRKYKVKTVSQPDDPKTMKEVITRRYERLKLENLEFPDLIVIDGGKAQVDAAQEAIDAIGVSVPILGLVKDENHRTNSLLFNSKQINIDPRSQLFMFLTAVQDEVHRYAITFHHTVHAKNTFASQLDSIKGIGKVKKGQILQILGKVDFEKNLKNLKLTDNQIEEILKLYGRN